MPVKHKWNTPEIRNMIRKTLRWYTEQKLSYGALGTIFWCMGYMCNRVYSMVIGVVSSSMAAGGRVIKVCDSTLALLYLVWLVCYVPC